MSSTPWRSLPQSGPNSHVPLLNGSVNGNNVHVTHLTLSESQYSTNSRVKCSCQVHTSILLFGLHTAMYAVHSYIKAFKISVCAVHAHRKHDTAHCIHHSAACTLTSSLQTPAYYPTCTQLCSIHHQLHYFMLLGVVVIVPSSCAMTHTAVSC